MRSEVEIANRVSHIWCGVLGIETAGADKNFFEIGGDSLTAMFAADAIANELAVQLSVHDMYEYPTLEGLCAYVKELLSRQPDSAVRTRSVIS